MHSRDIKLICGEWGSIPFVRTIPRSGDPWGEFREFTGTYFERYFTVVDKETLENAIRGHYMPLVKSLKQHPHLISKRIGDEYFCDWYKNKSCPTRDKKCKPGNQTPLCYQMKKFREENLQVVLSAIRDGSYLLVVTGE